MAHGHTQLNEADTQPIGARLWPTFRVLALGALIGAVLLILGVVLEGERWQSRFFFAYLIGYCFVLGLSVGMVALVILTHLFRAGWVVAVRRVPETFAANFWFVGLLALPILVAAMMGDAPLYPWSASLDNANADLHAAEQFIHHREQGGHHGEGDHGDHDDPADELQAAADPEDPQDPADGFYVAAAAEGEGAGHVEPHAAAGAEQNDLGVGAGGYQAAASGIAGMAYDGASREENRAIQKAYYTSLLSYMLDYKAYGGKLDVERDEAGNIIADGQVPSGKGFTWYNPLLFALRLVIYFAVLSLIGWYFWNKSVKQDETKDPALTTQREWWSPLSVTAFALTTTFLSFDILMSLDPAWYSTMFGVIFFANSFTAGIAATIIVCMVLQKKGYLKTVNTEHYHDLGKLLFAFVFFWGYVSFSQFMLIWYASLPETTYWFEIHGMTTVKTAPQYGSGWTYLSLLILFGHLFVPFAFLLSRHVKRNLTALCFAATWMLLMVYLDFYWYAMPFFDSPDIRFPLAELGAVMMLLCVVLAAFVRRYARFAPLAHGDPRLHESTALDTNIWAPIHH